MTPPRTTPAPEAEFVRRCFAYPEQVPGRKHGPRGYAHYEGYRDWLRDEFAYRCAYCLMREPWLRGRLGFPIDHCLPQAPYPSARLDYDNLVYACPWCNQGKAGVAVPNPAQLAYGTVLRVRDDGIIEATHGLGEILVEGLKLDHPDLTPQRRLVLRVVLLAAERNQPALLRSLLGYPDDLPNLRAKRPPGGNRRPEGIATSCYERRQRGDLPLPYGDLWRNPRWASGIRAGIGGVVVFARKPQCLRRPPFGEVSAASAGESVTMMMVPERRDALCP